MSKILARIVGHRLLADIGDERACSAKPDRIAVGRRFRDLVDGDRAACTRPVLDDDRLAQLPLQTGLHDARDRVTAAARRKADNEADGLVGISARCRVAAETDCEKCSDDQPGYCTHLRSLRGSFFTQGHSAKQGHVISKWALAPSPHGSVSRRSHGRSGTSRPSRILRQILVTTIVRPQGCDCVRKDRSQRGQLGAGKGAEDPSLEPFDMDIALRTDGFAEPGEAEQKRLLVGRILAAFDQTLPFQQKNGFTHGLRRHVEAPGQTRRRQILVLRQHAQHRVLKR